MKIKLRDETREYPKGTTPEEIAKSIGERFSKSVLCAEADGKTVGLDAPLNGDCELIFFTFGDETGRRAYRHTTSHILAQAVKRLYPGVKLAIGPSTGSGFYYDFDFQTPIGMDDLPKIEEEMKGIIAADIPVVREVVPREKAFDIMKDEPYKTELIAGLPEDAEISFYSQGDFTDLCAGPHVPSTGYIKAFALTSVTGAYWRGDEHNKMLTRVYGTAFDKKSALNEHLVALEEAKRRDHNKLGRETGVFMTDENVGQGLPLFMPKGAKLFQILTRFVEDEEEKRGYLLTKTPYLAKKQLYEISGHWDHYKEGMFVVGDEEAGGEVFALRPMTCPFQYTIYNNGIKSYRDLPLRYNETSTLFRNEASGEMHGLIRIRQFTLSEGHIICTPNQLEGEFKGALDLARYMLKCCGLSDDVSYRFSRWDPHDSGKYVGTPAEWEFAEEKTKKILDDVGLEYKEGIGEAAFYGPKLDIQIKNVHGKEDTLITIQVDPFLAERFDMTYIDENGKKARPFIVHRSSVGCYERTIALLIEKFGGAFPVWMAPEQARVISVADRNAEAAKNVARRLRGAGLRAAADTRNEKIGYKIREAQTDRIPYMLVVGDRETASGTVAVRSRKEGDVGAMTFEEFVSRVKAEIAEQIEPID